jgi:predicted RNA-binding protein with PUA-like domain
MTQSMQVGDDVLFYHSNAEPPGLAGLARVKSKAQPDLTQFDKKSEYYDPKATKDKPIWFCVEVQFVREFKHFISLEELRKSKALAELQVLKRGQRLSVQPVSGEHLAILLKIGDGK